MSKAKSRIEPHLPDFEDEEREVLRLLIDLDQSHLVEAWPGPGASLDDKRRLLRQVRDLDQRYPGGLSAYLVRAAALLGQSRRGDNPFAGLTPKVPTGRRLEYASQAFVELERVGLKQANRCGFVLVAGGLGERLGYEGIKVELPAETATGRTFLEHYVRHIVALQDRANAQLGEDRRVPFAIMTSDDTHAATVDLLERSRWFGLDPDRVTVMKQDKVASLLDDVPHLALHPDDPFALATKPHGHGDVHMLMHSTGTAQRWHAEGFRWTLFFQDTNGLAVHAIAPALGVSTTDDLHVNTIAVPRAATEAVGALVRLKGAQTDLTINVEYNQLDPLLRATTRGGDVPDETGYSPYPGNTNIVLVSLAPYVETLARTEGVVPEFINPKYADVERTRFASPTRLECMMQDYPKLLAPGTRIGFTQLDREVCFSAVKNATSVAAERQAKGLPSEGAATAEADLYAFYRNALRHAGAEVPQGATTTFAGVEATLFPIVALAPELVIPTGTPALRVARVELSPSSSLVLHADDVTLEDVFIDGAVVIRAVPGARVIIRKCRIVNRGWEAVPLSDADDPPPASSVRGFVLDKHETRVIDISEPGEHVIEGDA